MARISVLATVLVVVGITSLWCQQPSFRPSVEIGGFGSIVGDVTVPLALPSVATPPVSLFDAAPARVKPGGVVGFSLPLLSWLSVGSRLSVQDVGLRWRAVERLPINVADTVFVASVEHLRALSGSRVDVVGFARLLPWSALEVDVALGFAMATSVRVVQTQRFLDPAGIAFADGLLEQETGTADLSSALPLVVELRASWPLPLWDRINLVPSIGLRRDVASTLDGASWTTQQLVVGIAARIPLWFPWPSPEPSRRVDTIIVRDTITVVAMRDDTVVTLFSRLETTSSEDGVDRITYTEIYQRSIPKPDAFMEVSLSIDFVYPDGMARATATVKPTRVARIRTMPLFPIIVFDEGGTDIPERYLRGAKHGQHEVMRVVADSARANKRRRIDVVGYHDGSQPGAARAQLRAEAVAAALRGRGVSRGAITIRNTVAPSRTFDATVEMRCAPDVQLRSQSRETMLVSDLPVLRVRPDVVSDEDIASWSCAIRRSGQTVYEVSKAGPVPEDVRWAMGEMSMEAGASVEYAASFSITSAAGTTRKSDDAKVTVQAVADVADGAPTRIRVEEVVFGAGANSDGAGIVQSCSVGELYAGCTAREVEVYGVYVGAQACSITTNEERKP